MLKQSVAWASLIVTIGLYSSPPVALTAEQPVRLTNVSSNVVSQPKRLEINLSRRQVTLYDDNMPLKSYPVAIGRPGWETPTGNFQVVQMFENPRWINPLTGEAIPGGDPQNPLGRYWIGFWTNGRDWIGFHGTPNPNSVGKAASHGCIRMYNKDIEELFYSVTVGTPVTVVP
ncbi:MAG TPA: L,D-transpeptidase [Cyanobacteria bacterium UBA8803]|nr:L,D-transpeptidase [Cyanobacteria bacterium UBA9273]HBL62728.1 L,D-transpeptidase [Cyanobacteria bacterium UBA8803]